MAKGPFKRSRREVVRSLDAITEFAWVRAAEFSDIIYELVEADETPEGADEPDWYAQCDIDQLQALMWDFYQALAFCPLDSGNIEDLVHLSRFIFRQESGDLSDLHRSNEETIALIIASLRQDNGIPENIADILQLSGDAAYYFGASPAPGRAVPANYMKSIGRFLHKHFFRTTQEIYDLRFDRYGHLVAHMSLPLSLCLNPESGTLYRSREEATAALIAFVQPV